MVILLLIDLKKKKNDLKANKSIGTKIKCVW